MDQTLSKRTLGTVPFEKGFHFTTEKGVYTGITATGLAEFAKKLETVDVNSVQFHYLRGDFQKWIQGTLEDKELADRMCFVQPNLTGEELRRHLLKIVEKRFGEVQKQL